MKFLLCPACGDHFRGVAHEMAPMMLTCGHSCCSICADAVLLTATPVCPICSLVVTSSLPNFALAGIAEALWENKDADNQAQAPSSDGEAASAGLSDEIPELPLIDANEEIRLSETPALSCTAVGDLSLAAASAVPGVDTVSSVDSSSDFKDTTVFAEIMAHQQAFRCGVERFTEAIGECETHRVRIQAEYEHACETLVQDVNQICSMLQMQLKETLLDAKMHRDAEVKAIDTRLDSFLVAVDQLKAGILHADKVIVSTCMQEGTLSVLGSFRRMRELLDGFSGPQHHRTVKPRFDSTNLVSSISALFDIQLSNLEEPRSQNEFLNTSTSRNFVDLIRSTPAWKEAVNACVSACKLWEDASAKIESGRHPRAWGLLGIREAGLDSSILEKAIASRLDLVAEIKPWIATDPAVAGAYCDALQAVWKAQPLLTVADRNCGMLSQLLSILDAHPTCGLVVAAVFRAARRLVKVRNWGTGEIEPREHSGRREIKNGDSSFSTLSGLVTRGLSALSFVNDGDSCTSSHPPDVLAEVVATFSCVLRTERREGRRGANSISRFLVESKLIESILPSLEGKLSFPPHSPKAVDVLQYKASKLLRDLSCTDVRRLHCPVEDCELAIHHHHVVSRGCMPVLLKLFNSQPTNRRLCENILCVLRSLATSEPEVSAKVICGPVLRVVFAATIWLKGDDSDRRSELWLSSPDSSQFLSDDISTILKVAEGALRSFDERVIRSDLLPAIMSAPQRLLRRAHKDETLPQGLHVPKGWIETPPSIIQRFWTLVAGLFSIHGMAAESIVTAGGIPSLAVWLPYHSTLLEDVQCADSIVKFYVTTVTAYVRTQKLSPGDFKSVAKTLVDQGVLEEAEFHVKGQNHRVGHVIRIVWALLSPETTDTVQSEISQLLARALVDSGRISLLLVASTKYQGISMVGVTSTASLRSSSGSGKTIPLSHGVVAVLTKVLEHTALMWPTMRSRSVSDRFISESFHYLTTMFAVNYGGVDVTFAADGLDDEWQPSIPQTSPDRTDFWKQEFLSLEFLPLLVRLSSLGKVGLFDCPLMLRRDASNSQDALKVWNYASRKLCACASEKAPEPIKPYRRGSFLDEAFFSRFRFLTFDGSTGIGKPRPLADFALFGRAFRIRKGHNCFDNYKYTRPLERLFALMGYYHDVEKIQADGCSLLHNLAISCSASSDVVSSGGLVAIASAMHNHPHSLVVNEAAITALSAFSRSPSAALAISGTNLMTRTLQALKHHKNDPTLVSAFLKLLNTLVFVSRATPALVGYLSCRPVISKLRALFRNTPTFPVLDVLVKVDPEAFVFLDGFQRSQSQLTQQQAGPSAKQ